VIDIRTIGLIGRDRARSDRRRAAKRAFSAFLAPTRTGLLIRVTGDTIALSPPLIIEKAQIDTIVDSSPAS
jgi:beta-alanine--pyruvate transaminase